MAGKKDIVEQALKLIMGVGEEIFPHQRAENLSRFVSGSKLLDDAGNPQRLYHITNKDFDVFKPGGEDPTISGPAIWLSPYAEKQPAMHNVGSGSGFKEGTNVMPVYASIKNPLVLDTPEMQDWARTVFANKSSEFPYLISPEAKKAMQDEGYDGIILSGGSGVDNDEVIAFEGNQIKSAIGNTGAYDPTDPRIDRDTGGRIAKGPGGWIDDVVKMAGKVITGEGDNVTRLSDVKSVRARDALIKQLKSSINQVKSGYFQAGRQALIDQKSLDLHKSGMLPLQQGTIVTPPSTWDMPGDWRVSGYWYDEKDPRRFGYRLQNESGQTYDAAASDPRAGLKRDNPYSFGAGFKAYAGPNAAPPKPVASPVEKPAIAPKSPEILDAINKEYESLFGSEDPFKPKADGGRIAKGPGGWLDDVVKMAGKVISGEGEEAAKTGIRAYQGSPHDFAAERLVRFPDGRTEYLVGQPDVLPDVPQGAEVLQDFPLGRMRMDKIGTGEGAQAYGHGLYAAEAEPTARGYRDALTDRASSFRVENIDMPKWILRGIEGSPDRAGTIAKYREDFQNRLLEAQKEAEGSHQPWLASGKISSAKDILAGLDALERGASLPHTSGRMYEVNIAADPNTFLDWDRPLSEQPETVRRAVGREAGEDFDNATSEYNAAYNAYLGRPENPTPEELARLEGAVNDTYQRMVDARGNLNLTGAAAYRELAKDQPWEVAARKLREAGIPGIKYLDAGSRGAGDGTRNYVVFDENLISIIRKYGIAGASAMLGYNLMENLDSKQALAATMADREYKESRPKQAEGGSVKDEDSWLDAAMTVARNAADKATFGTSKYAAAGADYLTDAALDALGYENDADFDRALAEQEYAMKEGEEKNPAAAGAGDIIGYVAPYLAVGPAEGALTTLGYLSDYGGKVGKTGSLFARALGFADGGEVPEQGYLESVGTAINQAANPVRRLIGVRTVDLPEGVDEVDYEELMNLAADVLDKSMLGFGGADPYAKRPKKFPVSPTGKIVDRILPEEDDIDGALRIAKDVGGGLTPEEVGRRAAQDPATFDAMMQKYAIPDRDIAEYEALKSTVAKQPQDIQQMTHVGAPPMRDVKVDMPLFGGEYNIGSAPYNVAQGMSGAAQTAYDFKTAPLYMTPMTAPIGAGLDVAEGVATGDPLQASMAALGAPGKMAKGAIIGLSNYAMDPAEAQAGKERFFSKLLRTAEELPMEKMTGQQALAMLRKGASPEELRWTGTEDFLANTPQVTKQNLIDYINKNRVQTNEIIRGGSNKPTNILQITSIDDDILAKYKPDIDSLIAQKDQLSNEQAKLVDPSGNISLDDYGNYKSLRNKIDAINTKIAWRNKIMKEEQAERIGGLAKPTVYGPGSRYGERFYTPGGKGYQETTITIPPNQKTIQEWPVIDIYGNVKAKYDSKEAAERVARLSGSTVGEPKTTVLESGYRSSHWPELNTLGHIRTQILEATPEGANRPYKLFNVDEAQSDYAQDVRKYGLREEGSGNATKALNEFTSKMAEEWTQKKAEQLYQAAPELFNDIEEARNGAMRLANQRGATAIAEELGLADEFERLVYADQRYRKGLDPAPYVTSTQQWTDFSIKKALDQAIDSGADYFTFTPGEVHADRYNLARELSHIEYEPDIYGEYSISAIDKNGKAVLDKDMDIEEIEEYFGKEIAKKIKADEGRKIEDRPLRDWRVLENEQIKTKGDAMVDAYNNIYKKRVEKVVKDATGKKITWEVLPAQTANGIVPRLGFRIDDDVKNARFSDFNKGGRVTGGNTYGNDQSIANALALTREY